MKETTAFRTFSRTCIFVLTGSMLLSCVKDRSFDPPSADCAMELVANTTYAEVKNLYVDETMQIQQDLVIEGYVVSSDEAGNFFSALHFQDSPTDPAEGFQIEIDLRDSHLFYPIGTKIFIKLKGLYLGKSKEVFKIGGVFTSFGNASVGRLPSPVVESHIFVACDGKTAVEPTPVSLPDLPKNLTNTLVRFEDVEIAEEELGQSFAVEREETERHLTDCNDNEVVLLNSGYSDFQAELLPEGRGSITGVLLREKDEYRLAIRSLEDISFEKDRCADLVDEFSSNRIFISELADPDNNLAARFVELYNAAEEPLPLKGWTLRRYTNANTEISASVDLSDFTIDGKATFVVSPNPTEFETVYGFAPDLGIGKNSPADSNGDDNLELVDPFGKVIDVFGRVGEDGTGTDHEFEDGRALRNSDVAQGNPSYNIAEWTIYNDSGDAGTVKSPQNAPGDFTPGKRD
ncbi:DUF5689 domain-containing protein [Pricia sp. S334]|uniref:DUF5689 domain-containing protein n=1 Tax=Pricia mediterranea TaxID=3076079 RepID=A0ABU3L4M0_9FLAO|nr:DUF5689 domain-containing protein [Pricia sp. S334]MDT7828686.1 DUF5689 domain-containing protein [Pricia sp. S334]